MDRYLHLGPQHPQVVVASRVFDEWWERYQPVAYLSETILDEVPTGIDPNTIWTEFDGEYEEYISPGLQDSGRDDVTGYWFTTLAFSEEDRRQTVATEVRQYCENDDRPLGEETPCTDCTEVLGFCSGWGNQWCEIPNLRFPGGDPLTSLEDVEARLRRT